MSETDNIAPGIRLVQPTYKNRGPGRYTTPRQQQVVASLVEKGGTGKGITLGAVLVEAGYSENTAKTPAKVIESKGFQELLDEVLPDEELTKLHASLLKSMRLDHMVFPLGPKGEDDPNFSGANNDDNPIEKAGVHVERTTMTDEEIKLLIADVGGTVRRIVHGETARHVYFWAPNDRSRHDALKLAYDLKGKLGKKADETPAGNTYNTFIQNNSFDPNKPENRNVVDITLDSLMEATKRKVIDAGE